MRGLFFKQPLEFRLEVQGERFSQGDAVEAVLTVKNHGSDSVTLDALSVSLALGNAKKIKAKDADAYTEVSQAELERGVTVGAGQQAPFPVRFQLDSNAPITDKAQSLYLLYGNGAGADSLGALLLTCDPHPHVRALVGTFESVYGFTNKGESWKDGRTSIKFKAPDTRKLSLVDELLFSCRFDGADLCISYEFKVKKFDTTAVSINVKRGKAEVSQRWQPAEYLFGGGFINQEFVEQQINEALAVVSTEL